MDGIGADLRKSQGLLDDIASFVRSFVFVTPVQADAIALWIAHTHTIETSEVTPYLYVTSVEKRSGKSRLLDLLALVVRRPMRTVAISEAALFRSISTSQPTLLFDEIDAIFGPHAHEHESLRALLNAGFTRRTPAYRCVGDGGAMQVLPFDVFCPKALAGIGALPDTVADRSIQIRMRRKRSDEHVERFYRREVTLLAAPLRGQLEEWAAEAVVELLGARPDFPAALDDRASDIWEPLLAIVDLAGGTWPQRARHAACELMGGRVADDPSRGVRLLAAIKEVFDQVGAERMSTTELLKRLASDEDSEWSDISPKQLSAGLRPYGIQPRAHRVPEGVVKGYRRSDFEDAFTRYVPSAGAAAVTGLQRVTGVTGEPVLGEEEAA